MKTLLVARTGEKGVPEEKSLDERVEQAAMFAMVGARPESDRENSFADAGNNVRYDAHYSREAFRAMGFLLALKSEGNIGAVRTLHKRFSRPQKTRKVRILVGRDRHAT